jgi:hypothetical protein
VKIDNPIFCINIYVLYLGTTITNQNYIQEKIKSRLISGNAFHYSMNNLSVLPENTMIKIHGTVILPFVMYGCETW